MAEDYLNGKIKEIIEPMISALLIAQPEDPKFFMLHWLKNLYSLDYIVINKEKEELENLRLRVKGYKSPKADHDKGKGQKPLEDLNDIMQRESKGNESKESEDQKQIDKENNSSSYFSKEINEIEKNNNLIDKSEKENEGENKIENEIKNTEEKLSEGDKKDNKNDVIKFSSSDTEKQD